jgi:branched-chain amino acid transport system ATP-binding protein
VLEIQGLRAFYGSAEAVRGLTFSLAPGQVLAIVGPNGAGKSTLAKALCGLHSARSGSVQVDGTKVSAGNAVAAARAGLGLVPQGRRVFGSLTVGEHLDVAQRHRRPEGMSREELLGRLPRLRERLGVRARALSGGEQQMLAVARALLGGPRYLIMDEPTEGLSPAVVAQIAELSTDVAAAGVGVLLLEQDAGAVSGLATDCLHIARGVLTETQTEASADPGFGAQSLTGAIKRERR